MGRHSTWWMLVLATCLLVTSGCRHTEAGKYDDQDTDSGDDPGDCPYSCVSQLFCVQAEGIAHLEHSCAEGEDICCDLTAGPDGDTDTDSDSDSDSDTDTGEEPCPYECMTEYMCNAIEGEEHDGYACEEASDICCEDAPDTDTGYKSNVWKCLICETDAEADPEGRAIDALRPPTSDRRAGALRFLWNMLSGG